MSLFDIFGGGQQPQQQAPQQPAAPTPPGTPGNIPPEQSPTGGQVPNMHPAQEPNDDPMAQYKDLWETDPNAAPAGDDNNFVPLDATKLKQVLNNASFSNGITPEIVGAIANGGEEAVTAFKQAMDTVSRQVMMQSTLASNKMVEQAVARSQAHTQSKLPSMLKQQSVLTSDPLFNNPAIKPVFEAVQAQLSAKNPNATAQEIAQQSKDFITAMGASFAPPAPDPYAVPQESDFSKFLEG